MSSLPFATQSLSSPLSTYSGERLINCFARPSQGVGPVALIGRGGFVSQASVGGAVRSMVRHGGMKFVCANGLLWSVSGSSAVSVGSVVDDPLTTMASNGTEIAVVAGGRYFLYSGGVVTEHSTGSVVSPRGVVFADGFFVVFGHTNVREDAATISGINDGATFLGLDLFNAEHSPDAIVGAIRDHTELMFFGEETTETFFNTGDADQPFQRNQGLMIERGCLDQRTIAKEDNRVFWVADDGHVYASAGGTPTVISTREIEEVIKSGTVEGGVMFKARGHKFYGVRVKDKPTLCFDMTTNAWSEMSTGADHRPWIVTHSCIVDGVHYYGTSTGKIGVIDDDVYTDDGDDMVFEAISSPLTQSGRLFSLGTLHASFDTGRIDAGREAKVVLQLGPDGKTWGREKTRSLGRIGQREKLVRWNGLGSHRRVQARLRISDPVGRDLNGVQYG